MNRKIIAIMMGLAIAMVVFTASSLADGNADANGYQDSAPNSGDCVPDGSGYDSPNGPNGEDDSGNGNDGPAPNAGDGVPDGSGW